MLLGGAAGPLGGDDLHLVVRIGAGATLTIRSVAAMLAQPGPGGLPSMLRTEVEVATGATLDWETQPIISVIGSDHRSVTTVRAAADAQVRVAEAVLLGRHDEAPGRLAIRQRVEVDGGVVLDHQLVLGTGAPTGPGAHGDVRWMQSELVLGRDAAVEPSSSVRPDLVAGVFPLAPGASLSTSAGTAAAALRTHPSRT
jgi:urease accessory protein